MSSTNRGSKRVANDFYETPSWCVEAILPHLPRFLPILDPCAGKGAILKAAASSAHSLRGIEINPELQPDSEIISWSTDDALTLKSWRSPELVIMNPPFSKAEQFVRKALDETRENHGTVAALLRLSFVASKKRHGFMRECPPDLFVMSKRPSFNGLGTDSCDYAWFVWGPGRGGRWEVVG